MDAVGNTSFLCYPMIDKTMEILPKRAFAMDKMKPSNAEEFHNCHLQKRDQNAFRNGMPSEYMDQYVKFNIEKAHSIPQISHFKMQGDFKGVPEYNDSFKMYANYSKSAPIKKMDNLRFSGSEVLNLNDDKHENLILPEYREKYGNPSHAVAREKLLKHADHLKPCGSFTHDGHTEYLESFRDPQVRLMPERGKCREPFLRLKGKIEFNPEYRNTYLDFPRIRPTVKKPTSSLRLPISNTSSNGTNTPKDFMAIDTESITKITTTPEYRRANYHYQMRERPVPTVTDTQKKAEHINEQKFRRQPLLSNQSTVSTQTKFDSIGSSRKKVAKYGRRASVVHNAKNRDNSTILEANPKYNAAARRNSFETDDAFIVLNESCKRSSWLK